MLSACAGLVCTAAQAQVYGLKVPSGSGTPRTALFTIVPPDQPVTTPFNVPPAVLIKLGGNDVVVSGLAINGSNELFAYVVNPTTPAPTGTTAQLVGLDKTTGVATAIGAALQDTWVSGAAFDMNNHLWILTYDGTANTLQQIDSTNGMPQGPAITVSGLPSAGNGNTDIAFDVDNNAYLSGLGSIFSLDMATGAAVAVKTLPNSLTSDGSTPGFDGMAFYRNGEVWFTQGTMVDRIVYAPAINAPVGDFFNAVTDLSTDTGIPNSGWQDLAARPNRVIANNDSASTPPNTPVTINILGNDKDVWHAAGVGLSVDHDAVLPISTWGKTTAHGGTVTLNASGTVTYTPAAGFTGTDTFTYRVLADDGSWAEATVTVLVGTSATAAAAVPTLNQWALALLAAMVGLAALGFKRRA
jgi:hypothetical protein